jgi:hypothetical protein
MAAKLSMSDRNTLTLTTLLMSEPEASRMAVRFLMHWCWDPERQHRWPGAPGGGGRGGGIVGWESSVILTVCA